MSYQEDESNLTKREYFASMAMQGILNGGESIIPSRVSECENALGLEPGSYKYEKHYPALVALSARRYADALIDELNKEIK